MAKTDDMPKTKAELIDELQRLRQQVAVLQESADQRDHTAQTSRQTAETPHDPQVAGRPLFDSILLRTLMDSTSDYIFFKDRQSRIIRTNRPHAQLLGITDPKEAIGKTDFDFFPEQDAQRFYEEEQRIMESGQPVIAREWPIPGKEGQTVWVSESKIPFTDETGNVTGLVGIARDITDRKQTAEALRQAHAELEQYTASLERQTTQLRLASEIASNAAAIREVSHLLEETVHLVSNRFGFYHAGIFLIDEQDEYAVLRAASSENGRRMLERGHKVQVGGDGILGHVAATAEPRIAAPGRSPHPLPNPSEASKPVSLPDTRSQAVLPLNVRGRTIGLLDVQSTDETAISEDSLVPLRTLADQLAIAIDNARLAERAEAQLHELGLLYGEYSTAAWAQLASPDRAAGYIYDQVDVVPAAELSAPALDLAQERGQTVALAAPDAPHNMMATPLRLRQQIIGALGIQETEKAREWSPHEIALIEAVSEQVALALESARLFAETQKSAQTMQALYETSRVLSSALDEDTLIRAILEAVYRTLDCEHAIISTVDSSTKTIGIRHGIWQGQFDVFPKWIQTAQYPLDHPDILADIYRTGRTETIEMWDPRFNREIWDEFGHERLLRIFMPIKMRDRVLGVVEVAYDKRDKHQVGDDEVHMLEAFMDQAAVALENTRLFEQAQQRAQREHQTYEITAKIRRAPDIVSMLQTAVDELGQALHTDRTLIRLKAKPPEEQSDLPSDSRSDLLSDSRSDLLSDQDGENQEQ